MTANTFDRSERFTWWASLKHGGLLIAPGKLTEFFDETVSPLSPYLTERLRRDVFAVLEGSDEKTAGLLDTVFEQVLGFPKNGWIKGSAIDASWTRKAITGEAVKPRRVWKGAHSEVLPVFIPDAETLGQAQRLGVGRGRRAASRVVEWLRLSGQKIGVLTNGHQLRLIHAGVDYEAWCEWDIDLWFQEGAPGPQVEALRILLDRRSLESPDGKTTGPLLSAIAASRKGQAELSSVLGERVRLAVEKLIEASTEAIEKLDKGERREETRRVIYIAATRLVMRMVVVLFAEARELLPRDNPIYNSSYGLQGLREQLERLAGGRGTERLRHTASAWPRLLGLFRLIYEGSRHEALVVQKYGGGLFQPGDAASTDPVLRVLAVLEHPNNVINDAIVHAILELLTRSKVKVRQGKNATWVEAPVDFSDLSSEYIGILYEGLLDFELRRAASGDPMVFLNVGDQPALPFSRLEEMDDKTLSQLLEKLKKSTKKAMPVEGDGEKEDEESEETFEDEEANDESEGEDESADALESPADEDVADDASVLSARIHAWARRAAVAAKLIKPPKGKRGIAASDAFETELARIAKKQIYKTILPGGWFLVRWGGTRKGAGTFYTRPQLAGPTTRRTLEPLFYEGEGTSRKVRKPEELLSLKVCDPAMGSGSFLVSALRILTDALFESLHVHHRLERGDDRTICRLADGLPASAPQHETLIVPLDQEDFEARLKARLKRHVVERCLYGVDIDPLAVELARMSLWIETMDRNLPFHFLDHKLKCGNSLVGCWFDRFQDYPVMAWEREGGDKNHERFVHHYHDHEASRGKKVGQVQRKGDKWTQAIKDFKESVIKPEMRAWLAARSGNVFAFMKDGYTTDDLHRDIRAVFEELHALPVHEEESRALLYHDRILSNPELERLKAAFDTWCAIWFWPGDYLDLAPTPKNFLDPPEATRALVSEVAATQRFFHWEIEFPDVFTGPRSGFDATLGNPPWETLQPNSKEFFSNIDPLYRAYGKKEALSRQAEYFSRNIDVETDWLMYCARLKAIGTWTKHVATPFGEEDGIEPPPPIKHVRSPRMSSTLYDAWRAQRLRRVAYADTEHPFRYQGTGKPYTYKLFTEMAHAVLRPGGRVGFLLPAGIYTDKGATPLRRLFLSKCEWEWVFGFENREGIFDIHRSFKFNVIIVRKGAKTTTVRTAFMHRDVEAWQEAERHALSYPRNRLERFSPRTLALVEFRSLQDVQVASTILDHATYLSAELGPGPLAVKGTSQGDINLTSEVRRVWHATSADARAGEKQVDLVLCKSDRLAALPIYQGAMIHQMHPLYGGYDSGFGHQTKWRSLDWDAVEPQFWGPIAEFNMYGWGEVRLLSRRVINATNERSMISALIPAVPSSDTTLVYATSSIRLEDMLSLVGVLNSFVFDWMIRLRVAGATGATALDFDRLQELPVPADSVNAAWPYIQRAIARLNLCHEIFAPQWLKLRESLVLPAPLRGYARSEYERLRLRCIVDAALAQLYGLGIEDLTWILFCCDHPASVMRSEEFTRVLDQKGFWRVDKEKAPELRHTVLTLVAFHELKRIGLDAFLAQNNGEGWMIPETLRLADFGLGHDDRAKEHQPVASRLGPRFLPWQIEQSVEKSWEECQKHADLISRIVPTPEKAIEYEDAQSLPAKSAQTDMFGTPLAPTKRKRRS